MITRHGGLLHNVLNPGPLENALAVIAGPVFGQDMFPDLAQKACKVAEAIARGHVFSDANKRTAASALDLVLNLNGRSLLVTVDGMVATMEQLADGQLSFEDFVTWAAPLIDPPMIP